MKKTIRSRIRKFMLMLFSVLIAFLAAFIFLEIKITPVLNAMAESRAKNMASEVVNDAVRQVLCENGVKYEQLVALKTNADGVITAVTVDGVAINRLCAQIRGLVTDSLNSLGEKNIRIPLGSLTGVDILSGKGPAINIAVTMSGSAITKIVNDFQAAGINQTRHQMILEVRTKIYAITQNGTISTELTESIVVAETVIVGEVPEIYSDGADDMWENLIEY